MPVEPPGVTSILQAIEQRGETDTHPSYFVHVVLPPLLVVGTLLASFGAIVALLTPVPLDPQVALSRLSSTFVGGLVLLNVVVLLIAAVLGYVGFYRVIERRNEHLARDRILRRGLLDYGRSLVGEDADERAGEHLETMERTHNEALMEERERPAAPHLVLQLLLSLWYFYILYFLLKDIPRHARRQARFVRSARSLFEEAGLDPEQVPQVEPIEERSYLLAVVLLVVIPVAFVGVGAALPNTLAGAIVAGIGTLTGLVAGVLVQWWVYEDPVEHFRRQWAHEDALVELVGSEEPPAEGEPPEPGADGPADEDAAEPSQAPVPGAQDQPSGGQAEESEPAPEPEFTVWACGECEKKYKVPPKRPVRVTCKNCGNKEILEE